jgi:hypothetical protein
MRPASDATRFAATATLMTLARAASHAVGRFGTVFAHQEDRSERDDAHVSFDLIWQREAWEAVGTLLALYADIFRRCGDNPRQKEECHEDPETHRDLLLALGVVWQLGLGLMAMWHGNGAVAGKVMGFPLSFQGRTVPVTVQIADRGGNISAPVQSTMVLEIPR